MLEDKIENVDVAVTKLLCGRAIESMVDFIEKYLRLNKLLTKTSICTLLENITFLYLLREKKVSTTNSAFLSHLS